MNALFTEAMTLREVDPGVFEGELNKHWTIGPKVHGGAMVALCANAARTAYGEDRLQPVAVSANFLWAPDPGAMRLVTSLRKRGRRISVVDVELTQADRTLDTAAREKLLQDAAAVAFGDVAIIPIEFQANDWATRKGFRYHPRMDESTTATDLAPE